ncbi:GNAT family N-acetyltransferase [bacterium]|nr:GNAT family N-acetyltransferase [bacterium]
MYPYPLTRCNRLARATAFKGVKRVDLTIDCVLEDQLGRAYVDNADAPRAYQLRVGPLCYFAGVPENGGRAMIDELATYSIVMPSADGWIEALNEARGARVAECLARGLDPHWDAANEESCRRAEKLGYMPAGEYRAYFLNQPAA